MGVKDTFLRKSAFFTCWKTMAVTDVWKEFALDKFTSPQSQNRLEKERTQHDVQSCSPRGLYAAKSKQKLDTLSVTFTF